MGGPPTKLAEMQNIVCGYATMIRLVRTGNGIQNKRSASSKVVAVIHTHRTSLDILFQVLVSMNSLTPLFCCHFASPCRSTKLCHLPMLSTGLIANQHGTKSK